MPRSHLPDVVDILSPEHRVIGLFGRYKVAEQALLSLRKVGAIVLVANQEAVLAAGLGYLPHDRAASGARVIVPRTRNEAHRIQRLPVFHYHMPPFP